jgi:hypothetical protein
VLPRRFFCTLEPENRYAFSRSASTGCDGRK